MCASMCIQAELERPAILLSINLLVEISHVKSLFGLVLKRLHWRLTNYISQFYTDAICTVCGKVEFRPYTNTLLSMKVTICQSTLFKL